MQCCKVHARQVCKKLHKKGKKYPSQINCNDVKKITRQLHAMLFKEKLGKERKIRKRTSLLILLFKLHTTNASMVEIILRKL